MKTAKQKAKLLNDHHLKSCAGFYSSNGGRYFQARAAGDRLEVRVFEGEWQDATEMKFSDHNGRNINLE